MYFWVFKDRPQFAQIVDDKFIKAGAKVTVLYCIEKVMNKIKAKLTYAQKEMFFKTYFGPYLYLNKFTPSPQILHNLLCRIVNVPESEEDEIHFKICGKLFCYSLQQFALITGLKCDGAANYKYDVTMERSAFAKAYFKDSVKLKRETLET